jgi:hypothetical protein
MRLKFGDITVRGTAVIDVVSLATQVIGLELTSQYVFTNGLKWEQDEGTAPHPHAVLTNDPSETLMKLCFKVRLTAETRDNLKHAGKLAAWIVGTAEDAYKILNPTSVADDSWRHCHECGMMTNVNYHECAMNKRKRRAPSASRFGIAALCGCGVTGSWMLPVLSRATNLVLVIDNDFVDPSNHNGRWSARLERRTHKITAAAEPRYLEFTSLMNTRINRDSRFYDVNLVVLAMDNVQGRLDALSACCHTSAWFVDVRVARNQLVIWTFQTPGSERDRLVSAWVDSLREQDHDDWGGNACGQRHDNVPLVAGVMAAAFLSWWINRPPEDGIWTIDLTQPWINQFGDDADATTPSMTTEESQHSEIQSEIQVSRGEAINA